MRLRVGLLVGLIVAGVTVAVVLVAGASGSPSVTALPTHGQITGYQLTSDDQGASTLVWSMYKFVNSSGVGSTDSLLRVSEQNSQGTWSAPVQIGGLQTANPVLAESRSGAAVIVWSHGQTDPDRTLVDAVTRNSADAAWSAPHTIWSVANTEGALPAVGIDSAGIATIVWTSYGPGNPAIWTASIDAANTRATRPRQLVPIAAGGSNLTLAVSGTGAALVSWQRQLRIARNKRTARGIVHAAEFVSYRPAAGRWLEPHELATFAYPEEPVGMNIWAPASAPSAVTTQGVAALAWLPGMRLVISTRDPANGSWSQTRMPESRGAFDEGLVGGPHDSLRAFWSSSSPTGTQTLRTATSADGVDWSASRTVSLPRDEFEAFPASDPAGNDALVFAESSRRVLLKTRTASKGWSAPRFVGRGWDPVVTIAADGSVTVVWWTGVSPHEVLKTRTYR